ncbi:hypothetical protein M9H77_26575 [Catharanthus roseus]|uniref:Uncharacterized protein n=1 Tax=Catharanthus roseus TaxID=4058 RepID=A0ACC0ACS4_CATRO|nr:hypothetical protein M9H77_26575 [Catharanthus roseus]
MFLDKYKADWPFNVETRFVTLLCQWKQQSGHWTSGKFGTDSWKKIVSERNAITSHNNIVKKFIAKFFRLREKWLIIHKIRMHLKFTGVLWSSMNGNNEANEEQWENNYATVHDAQRVQQVFMPNFDQQTYLFHDFGAQGCHAHLANQIPPTDEAERQQMANEQYDEIVRRLVLEDEEDEVEFICLAAVNEFLLLPPIKMPYMTFLMHAYIWVIEMLEGHPQRIWDNLKTGTLYTLRSAIIPNDIHSFRTCISAWAISRVLENYRCKKNTITQNVIAGVDHDNRTIFLYIGWEGNAHDRRVFVDATTRETANFPWPLASKYYLVDADFTKQPNL